jgi:hypothetical protein
MHGAARSGDDAAVIDESEQIVAWAPKQRA